MFTDFDLHMPTGRLALRRVRERIPEIVVTDITSGELLTRVPQRFLPQTPRFSPDGNCSPVPATAEYTCTQLRQG